jgi:hypothetical protein
MQSVLDVVWDKLLPSIKPGALAADDEAEKKLKQRLAKLSLKMPESAAGAPEKVVGKKFVFPANEQKLESLALEGGSGGAVTLVTWIGGSEQRLVCAPGEWTRGNVAWANWPARPAASCGAWTANDTFTAKACFYETPFVNTIRLKFSGDELRVSSEQNVGFGATREAELVGRAE